MFRLTLLCQAQRRVLNILVKKKALGWLPILAKVTLASAGVQRKVNIHSIFHESCIPAAYDISAVNRKKWERKTEARSLGDLKFCYGCAV